MKKKGFGESQPRTGDAKKFIKAFQKVGIETNWDKGYLQKFLQSHSAKLDESLLKALPVVFKTLTANQSSKKQEVMAGLFVLFGNLVLEFPQRDRALNWEFVIAAYQLGLTILTPDAFPEQWAETQNNLGGAYRERIQGERAENLEQAIAAYQQVLQIYTCHTFPQDWAGTQLTLGNVYRERIRGERAENLEQAIAAYQQALQIYTCHTFPQDWAGTQNNLGNAYQERIKGERAENLEQAIAAYEQALQVRTRDTFPQDWAETQNNLGAAYSNRIKGERAENLEQAIAAYEQALQVRTRDTFPQDWAETQNNLGAAYSNRIKGERAENLEQAIAAYEQALQIYTCHTFPKQWAMTQHNLGITYILVDREEQAITCYKNALEIYTPSSFPVDCLRTGRSLGDLAYNMEDWETASFGYDNAIQAVEQSRDWATSAQTKRELLTNALPIYEKMVECCINLEQYDRALLTVERSKSRTLIELLNEADLEPKNATEEQLQRYRQLRREIAALQQSFEGEDHFSDNPPSLGRGGAMAEASVSSTKKEELKALLKQRDELVAEINDPDFNAVQTVRPELPDFTQLLPPETVIIEWYLPLDPDLGAYAFLVTLEDNQPHIQYHRYSPEQREALDQFNESYFSDYRDFSWYSNLNTRLDELAQLLDLSQLLQKIPATCNSAILVPHLYLHLFPLHALAASCHNDTSAPLQDATNCVTPPVVKF